ncbi:hypothetical protein A7K50_03320 [Dehalobacter sp. MCB1]|uniref:NUMOD4 domain-containing protein n=1 Tax=Dehalobacter sp. MCB1 TaxID=1844756 RepID=UPI000E6B8F07|nr:NUMOD4 domain-containing protein [Dehalobacter sp. MCB1]RJE47691.1 hypothetical protein A7K50_03320 [Dehalobacter sp. MCB1]
MLWKNIKDFDNYQISNTGLVRKDNKIIKSFDNKGYERILLTNGNLKSKKLIHRLVAEHFIPNPDNKPQVNHKDLNTKNNNDWNLEWVTNKENVQHAILNIPERKRQLKNDMSLIGKKFGKENAMKSRKPIEQLSIDGNLIKQFSSAREASHELDISYKCISKCCLGSLKSYKGFLWRFVDLQSQTTIEITSNDVESRVG